MHYVKIRNFTDDWTLSSSVGQANKARIIYGGIYLGTSNLEGHQDEDYEGYVFASAVGLPPKMSFGSPRLLNQMWKTSEIVFSSWQSRGGRVMIDSSSATTM